MKLTNETKVIIGIVITTLVVLFGGVYFLSKQDTEQIKKENKPLTGLQMKSEGASHVPEDTNVEYESNPPHSGDHYVKTARAAAYDKAPKDGFLVHSLEHGAVILWYDEKLANKEIEKLKEIFKKMSGKTIMTPRKGMGVPVALTSWTKILKLEEINEQKILEFYETNYNRAPENAPI